MVGKAEVRSRRKCLRWSSFASSADDAEKPVDSRRISLNVCANELPGPITYWNSRNQARYHYASGERADGCSR